MKKSFSLSIPKPCHENWQNFSATDLGGFCSGCQKEVIDFTTWNEAEIKNYFQTSAQSACGRFRADQLKRYNASITRPPGGTNWWQVSLFSLTLAASASHVHAQQVTKPEMEITHRNEEERIGKIVVRDPRQGSRISGVVKDETGTGIAGATILVKGTSSGTVSDESGQFTVDVQDSSTDILVISFIGYETIEQRVNGNYYLMLQLKASTRELMGELMIVTPPKWWTPRGMWWRIKNIF